MSETPSLPPACAPGPSGGCSICGDEGLEAEILELLDGGRSARVRIEARRAGRAGRVEPAGADETGSRGGVSDGATEPEERVVALDLLDGVTAGDRIVVHLGFAIAAVRGEES